MVEAIRKAKTNPELEQMRAALSRILNDWRVAKGQKNCWPIGDCILTLEVPTGYQIFTTNLKHFQLLCAAVGKEVTSL